MKLAREMNGGHQYVLDCRQGQSPNGEAATAFVDGGKSSAPESV